MNQLISTRPARACLTLGLYALTLALAATASLSAATLTVSKLGGGAYTNIQDALNAAARGDIVFVEQGEYRESLTITNNIELLGADPRSTKILATGHGIVVTDFVSTTIRGLWISSATLDGITVGGSTSARVENCVIVHCRRHGINLSPRTQAGWFVIRNCILARNGEYALFASNTYGQTEVVGNIFYQNKYGGTIDAGPVVWRYNCVFETQPRNYNAPLDIPSDPLFQDEPAGNFLLRTGSPCINRGDPDLAANDPDGTRNDMGAFGGPRASEFWPYPPGGPFITELRLLEGRVTQGGKLKIHAVGTVR